MAEDRATQVREFADRFTTFFDVDATSVIDTVQNTTNQPTADSQSVNVIPVHTFVVGGHTKDIRLSDGILVPSFASHWGVVVGTTDAYTLYHLVFRRGQDTGNNRSTGDSIRGKFREVDFHHTQWKQERRPNDKIIEVGKTSYSHIELIQIGKFPKRSPSDIR